MTASNRANHRVVIKTREWGIDGRLLWIASFLIFFYFYFIFIIIKKIKNNNNKYTLFNIENIHTIARTYVYARTLEHTHTHVYVYARMYEHTHVYTIYEYIFHKLEFLYSFSGNLNVKRRI